MVAGARGLLLISADMDAQPPTALSCSSPHLSRKHPTADLLEVTRMIASVDVHPTCACNYTAEGAYESRWCGPVAAITRLNKALLASWSANPESWFASRVDQAAAESGPAVRDGNIWS